ncbi:MAG: hypothetical protein M1596_06640 [Firmicutes bacterium]|jgi:hypothetical protein|nr:hypothetical protein [Bacillota bacterium]MCL5971595.1 hypothetical protein [Bacillota bacterium]
MLRMIVGSVLGILGFGTLSLGFEQLNGETMIVGVIGILLGTFIAMGVLAPLRRKHNHRK